MRDGDSPVISKKFDSAMFIFMEPCRYKNHHGSSSDIAVNLNMDVDAGIILELVTNTRTIIISNKTINELYYRVGHMVLVCASLSTDSLHFACGRT